MGTMVLFVGLVCASNPADKYEAVAVTRKPSLAIVVGMTQGEVEQAIGESWNLFFGGPGWTWVVYRKAELEVTYDCRTKVPRVSSVQRFKR